MEDMPSCRHRRRPTWAGRLGRGRHATAGGLGLCLFAPIAVVSCSPTAPGPLTGGSALSGTFELTIESNCTALPLAMRTRTYIVSIQDGVAAASGTFFRHPVLGLSNRIAVSVAGSAVTLSIDFPSGFDHIGLFEEPTPGQYFGILGSGTGSVSDSKRLSVTMTGTLNAAFAYGEDLIQPDRHVGCARSPNSGTFRFEPRPDAAPTAVAGSPVVTSVQIQGPTSLAPGETAQFVANATRSDGSQLDITATAFWTIGGNTWFVFSHDGGGLVTGKQNGQGTLFAVTTIPNTSLRATGTRSIVVTPPGTVMVAGVVTTSGGPVTGATVVVPTGVSAGLSAVTDAEGRFAIFGVRGPSDLSITKTGFAPVQVSVNGTEHQTLNITLTAVAPMPSVAGTYTLTLEASPSCRAGLTEAARRRTYTATLVQNTTRIFGTLSGGSLVANRFEGRADPGDVQVTLGSYWDYYYTGGSLNPFLIDNLVSNPFRQLVISGRTSPQPTADGFAGPLEGEFLVFDRTVIIQPPFVSAPWPLESCEATDHTFSLTRTGAASLAWSGPVRMP